jgi:hypothetical protein
MRAHATAEMLCVRLGDGRRCLSHVATDTDDIDARLWAGDVAAVYDAMVEAIGQLRIVADQFGDVIGDGESLARVQAMRAKCKLKRCDRD